MMKSIHIIIFVISLISTGICHEIADKKIVSGVEASQGQFPYMVGITTGAGLSFCGGSVLSEEWVLTSASCVYGRNLFKLRFGSAFRTETWEEGIVEMHPTEYIYHADYNEVYNVNDIALIRLPEPLNFTEFIQPIPLPAIGSFVGSQESVTMVGFGSATDGTSGYSENLLYKDLTTISDLECSVHYGVITINGKVVCCKGDTEYGTCHGDEGGPLVQNGTQVGIASFVSDSGCTSGVPSGYTRTSEFLDWIATKTDINFS